MTPVLVVVTCASDEEARAIGRRLVEIRLVAGAQIIPISSVYRWEGEIVDDEEWLLICKTRSDRYPRIEDEVGALHSYEVVPIYMIEMTDAGSPYSAWIDEVTAPPSP